MRAAEMDELVALAAADDLRADARAPAALPPRRAEAEGADRHRRARRRALRLRQPPVNLGIVRENENALWSLGVHDLSVILYLLDEDPRDRDRQRPRLPARRASRTSSSATYAFPSGKIAHMHLSWLDPHKMRKLTVVGREKMVVFDDMELERKVTVYEKSPWKRAETYGEWQTRSGDISIPKIPTDEPLRLECTHFLRADRRQTRQAEGRARRGARRPGARDADRLPWPLRFTPLRPSTRAPCSATTCACSSTRCRQAAVARRSVDREARPAPAGRDRRRHRRLDRRRRLRRLDDRAALHRRRPVVHP